MCYALQGRYGFWSNFPAYQLGISKNVCGMREYGLCEVYVIRESTVDIKAGANTSVRKGKDVRNRARILQVIPIERSSKYSCQTCFTICSHFLKDFPRLPRRSRNDWALIGSALFHLQCDTT